MHIIHVTHLIVPAPHITTVAKHEVGIKIKNQHNKKYSLINHSVTWWQLDGYEEVTKHSEERRNKYQLVLRNSNNQKNNGIEKQE